MLLAQVGWLALAFVLSALIGAEREFRGKAAGLRTYSTVGLAAAVFTLCSKYGFTDLPSWVNHAAPEPTRIASMVVTGIGFIGAGIIFVDRTSGMVEGLTTAAILWLTAAVGMAAGAGLWHLALLVTGLHLLLCFCLRPIEQWLSDKGMRQS
ncbi:MAG TPA: MgtC/SapB family protein [Candidatus Baltobacteraceae bacterium]|nr:MgtC/SapB family protein [Candidatus Baltobacteraceae bacterium]